MPVFNIPKLKRIESLENCVRSGYFFEDFGETQNSYTIKSIKYGV